MEATMIESLLTAEFKDAKVAVSGDGYHWHIAITSELFQGKSKVQRQQMVYSVLNPHIVSGEIHAVTFNISSPSDYT